MVSPRKKIENTTPPRAGRREWIGLAVIALPCLLYSMDLTVLHLAVPQLSEQLRPSSVQLLWIIDIYGFLVAGSLITMGTLGDRIGRRRLLLIGAAAFGIASVIAAFSTSATMLIATRALLGIAGATVAPSTLSLIRNMFLDPQQRTAAIGVWVTSYSVGGAIAPLLGGLLLEYFWWGSVFLLAVPVMLLLLLVGPRLLPEYRDPEAGRPDLISAGLSLAAILAMIFGLKQIAQSGLAWRPILFILAGLALGVVFVRRQFVLADPFIDLRLFRLPAFRASLATYGLAVFVLFGGFLFLPQYLQLVLGLTPLKSGLWTLPWALAFIVGSNVTPVIARRIRPGFVMAGGLILAALGLALLTGLDATSEFWVFVTGTVAFALGFSPVFTLTNDIIVGSAPPERAGAAAAMAETGAEFGGAAGIAVFGSLGIAVYRGLLASHIPAGLSPESVKTAMDTLGGAFAVAEQLPALHSSELVGAARGAFLQGLQLSTTISAIGTLGIAILILLLLRKEGANIRSEADVDLPTAAQCAADD